MIRRRKRTFANLHQLLRQVEANPDDLKSVLELNAAVLAEVLRAEEHILRHRTALRDLKNALRNGRLSKAASLALRTRIKRLETLVDSYFGQIFIWKCFGDGLAFAYLDTFAVKHAFFDTETPDVKPEAGFLTGKSGRTAEWYCLETAIANQVPAVLCDLTTTLRHGDVCLLGASDPYLLEVKSGRHLNKRGKRQARKVEQIHEFLRTDSATRFRGLGETRRAVVKTPVRSHEAALNTCIAEAAPGGTRICEPEPGLRYVAAYRDKYRSEILETEGWGQKIVFMLNADKKDRSWAPYRPFTLSIRSADHLFDFIVGDLILIVIFDVARLCEQLTRPGWEVRYRADANYGVQFRHRETGARMGLSQQFLGRIGYELLSPAWIAESQWGPLGEIEARLFDPKSAEETVEITGYEEMMFGRE